MKINFFISTFSPASPLQKKKKIELNNEKGLFAFYSVI